MKHQLMLYPNTCLLTSFAMAMDVNQAILLKEIGHNGQEIWWPELDAPNCYRGHHPQELIHVANQLGFAVTEIERFPALGHGDDVRALYPASAADYRFRMYIENYVGVLCMYDHAVAINRGEVFDPGIRTEEPIDILINKSVSFFIVQYRAAMLKI